MDALIGVVIGSILTFGISYYLAKWKYKRCFEFVVLEKRIEKHQEAFKLCWDMLSSLSEDRVGEMYNICLKWWNENCLYLAPRSREMFRNTYYELYIFQLKNVDDKKKYIDVTIPETRKILMTEIGLPWLEETEEKERKELKKLQEEKK